MPCYMILHDIKVSLSPGVCVFFFQIPIVFHKNLHILNMHIHEITVVFWFTVVSRSTTLHGEGGGLIPNLGFRILS